MAPTGNYTEPNAKKKIIKIGSQLAMKSGNRDTNKFSPFLKSVKKY